MLCAPFDEQLGVASNTECQTMINNKWQTVQDSVCPSHCASATSDVTHTLSTPSSRRRSAFASRVQNFGFSWCVYGVVPTWRGFRRKPSHVRLISRSMEAGLKKGTRQSVMAGTCRPTTRRDRGLVGSHDGDRALCVSRWAIRTMWSMATWEMDAASAAESNVSSVRLPNICRQQQHGTIYVEH